MGALLNIHYNSTFPLSNIYIYTYYIQRKLIYCCCYCYCYMVDSFHRIRAHHLFIHNYIGSPLNIILRSILMLNTRLTACVSDSLPTEPHRQFLYYLNYSCIFIISAVFISISTGNRTLCSTAIL